MLKGAVRLSRTEKVTSHDNTSVGVLSCKCPGTVIFPIRSSGSSIALSGYVCFWVLSSVTGSLTFTPAISEQSIYNQVYGYQHFKQNHKRTLTPRVTRLQTGSDTLLRIEEEEPSWRGFARWKAAYRKVIQCTGGIFDGPHWTACLQSTSDANSHVKKR